MNIKVVSINLCWFEKNEKIHNFKSDHKCNCRWKYSGSGDSGFYFVYMDCFSAYGKRIFMEDYTEFFGEIWTDVVSVFCFWSTGSRNRNVDFNAGESSIHGMACTIYE